MGYFRAEEILPEEIIRLIQKYVDGESVYIPRKRENRRENETAYRRELQDRNRKIYRDYLSGKRAAELAESYFLSEKSIHRIIRQERQSNVS